MRRTVLVVDDEPDMCELIASVLEQHGYEALRAPDGKEALELVERHDVDLVLADVVMPRLDGVSLVRRLRERGQRLPVVLMSAVVDRVDEPGAPFIGKPFDLDQIVAIVEHALGEAPA